MIGRQARHPYDFGAAIDSKAWASGLPGPWPGPAEVTVAVRNVEAGNRTAEDIASTTSNISVRVAPLDLADRAKGCQSDLALASFDRAGKSGELKLTSCAVQLHTPLWTVIVPLVTFTIA